MMSVACGRARGKNVQGLLPTNRARQQHVLDRKRAEYRGFVQQFFGERAAYRTDKDKQTLRDVRAAGGGGCVVTSSVQK